jgi:hypothetical protein
VFDGVIAHSDRGGHNWLAVPDSSGNQRLKLVDHGYAFGFQGGLNSTFYADCQGDPLEAALVEALRRCSSPRQMRQLERLFEGEPHELESTLARAKTFADNGHL